MTEETQHHYDVVVVGAGNAGLIAAITAREQGASVLLLEASDKSERGGNSRFASAVFRAVHTGESDLREVIAPDLQPDWDQVSASPYSREDFFHDVAGPSLGQANTELLDDVAKKSLDTIHWMREHGVRWQLSTVKLSDKVRSSERVRTNPGSELIVENQGLGLVESLFTEAEKLGIEIWYDSPAIGLMTRGRNVEGVFVRRDAEDLVVTAKSTILASGGFEASADARARYLGAGWDMVKVRGTRFNTGTMIQRAIEAGAATVGNWNSAHAVPVDADSPAVGDQVIRDSTARYSYPYGITVNFDGERFFDEGEDDMVATYATVGAKLLAQKGGAAYQVFDSVGAQLLEPRYSSATPVQGETLEELAEKMEIDSERFLETVHRYNASCVEGIFDAQQKDGLSASPAGQPQKSNWATPLAVGPFYAFRVTCGITMTFGGVAVDVDAKVLGVNGKPIPGLFSTGEMASGFFAYNVPSGTGLMKGAVTARNAGRSAVLALSGSSA